MTWKSVRTWLIDTFGTVGMVERERKRKSFEDAARCKPPPSLKMYQNEYGTDTVIAYDEEDAMRVWCEQYGENANDYFSMKWDVVAPDWLLIKVYNDLSESGSGSTTLSASDWIKLRGRGFLCSTEY